jgi:hypothetical protein
MSHELDRELRAFLFSAFVALLISAQIGDAFCKRVCHLQEDSRDDSGNLLRLTRSNDHPIPHRGGLLELFGRGSAADWLQVSKADLTARATAG